MAANTLCFVFRRMTLNSSRNTIRRCISMRVPDHYTQNPLTSLSASPRFTSATESNISVKFTPGSLNINFESPAINGVNININELPLTKFPQMQEPLKRRQTYEELPFNEKSLELPATEDITDKHAVTLVRIRRKKMKKHKRKKLRRKMKVIWEHIRERRNLAKEKAFKAELHAKVVKAEAFDAKQYVAERLQLLNKERIPYTYRGEILPQEQILQFLKAKQDKRESKQHRRQVIQKLLEEVNSDKPCN